MALSVTGYDLTQVPSIGKSVNPRGFQGESPGYGEAAQTGAGWFAHTGASISAGTGKDCSGSTGAVSVCLACSPCAADTVGAPSVSLVARA